MTAKPSRTSDRNDAPLSWLGLRGLCVFSALLCAFCSREKSLAGGYDDVENPALSVTLKDTLGHAYGPGEVHVYARYQNPGEDSLPLAIRAVPAGASVSFRDATLLQAMTLSLARGTPWPSRDSLEFNLVAIASGGEAFMGGYRLIKSGNGAYRFLRLQGGVYTYPDAKGRLETFPALAAPVLALQGRIGAKGVQLGLKSVFIGGSPYRADVASDGSFRIARLAQGRYELKAVSADAKVYAAADSLGTGGAYEASDWSEADLIWVE